jgi:undecaprenyl-diphosphatase
LSGVSREIAAEFSFFMGIPIIFGAGALKIVKYGFNFSATELFVLGFSLVATFIVSIFAIKFLIRYLKNNDFQIFGWYRIIFGILVMIYFIFK